MNDRNRKHFKALTTFINAYRLKMTHSGSSNQMANAVKEMNKQSSLSDFQQSKKGNTKQKVAAESEEIKFDYEEFMRIYNFEKNQKSMVKEDFRAPPRTLVLNESQSSITHRKTKMRNN